MINQFLKIFVTWHAKRVETSFMHPKKTQEQTFLRLKQVLKQAKFAKTTGFTSCNSLEDIKLLPISDSKILNPLFEQVKKHGNAKRKLFGSSPVLMFARTSGTTAQPKDIPINKAYMKALDRSLV